MNFAKSLKTTFYKTHPVAASVYPQIETSALTTKMKLIPYEYILRNDVHLQLHRFNHESIEHTQNTLRFLTCYNKPEKLINQLQLSRLLKFDKIC